MRTTQGITNLILKACQACQKSCHVFPNRVTFSQIVLRFGFRRNMLTTLPNRVTVHKACHDLELSYKFIFESLLNIFNKNLLLLVVLTFTILHTNPYVSNSWNRNKRVIASREVTWLQGVPYNLEELGSRPGTKRNKREWKKFKEKRNGFMGWGFVSSDVHQSNRKSFPLSWLDV